MFLTVAREGLRAVSFRKAVRFIGTNLNPSRLSSKLHTPPSLRALRHRYVDLYERLLQVYGDREGCISVPHFVEDLKSTGLPLDDPRLLLTIDKLKESGLDGGVITQQEFIDAVSLNIPLIDQALRGKFAVPEFSDFTKNMDQLYEECIPIRTGEVARYIPELSRADPELWGVSLCTVDGQRHSVGDSDVHFTVQSGGKCFSYAVAVEEYGADLIHKHIGKEPSGASFNSLFLNSDGKPHNPMINAGALVLSSLIKPAASITERVNFMLQKYCLMAGVPERSLKCDIMTCDSEMDTAHRNYALMHYMMGMKVFPEGTPIEDTLKFYTRLCSVEVDCRQGAVMAATLANSGLCPTTGKKILGEDAVRDTLTLMHSCGMYDSAGEFSFAVGLPAKSGVSGVIMVVVPNVMGLCLYSPRVNRSGNSIRGLHFCKRLVEMFNFHNYDSLVLDSSKIDPRRVKREHKELALTQIMYASHAGALSSLQRYLMAGKDFNLRDYDGRSPLHLAAAEGHLSVVQFLLTKAGVELNPTDRWSRTPLDDAIHFGRDSVVQFLSARGAASGSSQLAGKYPAQIKTPSAQRMNENCS